MTLTQTLPITQVSVTTSESVVTLDDGTSRIHLTNTHATETLYLALLSGPTYAASLTYNDNGGAGDSEITTGGDFLAEGFAVGDTVIIAGTVSNNGTVSTPIKTLSATTMTFDGIVLTDEGPVASTLTTSQTLTTGNGFPIMAGGSLSANVTPRTGVTLYLLGSGSLTAGLLEEG